MVESNHSTMIYKPTKQPSWFLTKKKNIQSIKYWHGSENAKSIQGSAILSMNNFLTCFEYFHPQENELEREKILNVWISQYSNLISLSTMLEPNTYQMGIT